jgi:hypothetical protein
MLKNRSELALRYAVYILSLFSYLAVLIFFCFFLKISIGRYTLPLGFLSYNLILFAYLKINNKKKYVKQLVLMALVSVFGFLIIGAAYTKTYDFSYDGMYYHEPAVYALAKGWNPIYSESPLSQSKISQKLAVQIIEGSPKVTWSVEASIYKFSRNIDTATCLNLILAFVAFVFIYTALLNLGLSKRSSIILAILMLVVENTFADIFSFREDGISYYLLAIATSSLVMLIRNNKDKAIYFWCLSSSLVLMAGTKLSNIIVITPILALIIYFSITKCWYKIKAFKLSLALGLILSCLFLFNPYFTNYRHFSALDYPYNINSVSAEAKQEVVPQNILGDNRFELFLYGIFGRVNSGTRNTSLKVPFSFNLYEVNAESDGISKGSGGYGLIFSGVIILCVLLFVYLAVKHKSDKHHVIKWLTLATLVVIISCLITPYPNYARYNLELEALPILFVIAWLLLRPCNFKLLKSTKLLRLFVALIAINSLAGLILVLALNNLEFQSLNNQLSSLKSSKSTYEVYASTFSANYELLESKGLKIKVSPKSLHCSNIQILYSSRGTTELCKESLN